MSLKVAQMILAAVAKNMSWSADKAALWYETPNSHFGGVSPQELVVRGRGHKVLRFIEAAGEENGMPNAQIPKESKMILACLVEKKIEEWKEDMDRARGYGHGERTSREMHDHLNLAIKMIREYQTILTARQCVPDTSALEKESK